MTFGRETPEVEAHEQLDRFISKGGNFIDTADVYNSGESERIIGRWLAKLPGECRRDIILATKVYFGGGRADVNATGLSRGHITATVKEALARLQTDYIDLLQIHNWDHETPPELWLQTMKDLIAAGKVHMIGVCNVTGWQLQHIITVGRNIGVPIVSAQLQYSLLVRGIEWELMDCCEHNGVSVLPWSALKGGWLTGKYERGVVPGAAAGRVGQFPRWRSGGCCKGQLLLLSSLEPETLLSLTTMCMPSKGNLMTSKWLRCVNCLPRRSHIPTRWYGERSVVTMAVLTNRRCHQDYGRVQRDQSFDL